MRSCEHWREVLLFRWRGLGFFFSFLARTSKGEAIGGEGFEALGLLKDLGVWTLVRARSGVGSRGEEIIPQVGHACFQPVVERRLRGREECIYVGCTLASNLS